MKKFRLMIYILLVLVVLLSTAGCGAVVRGAKAVNEEYSKLIELYQTARREAANGQSCLALTFSEMQFQATLANNYMVAEANKAAAYRKALADYGKLADGQKAMEGFQESSKAYLDDTGQPIPASKLDLAELAKSNALPGQQGFTLQVMVTSFVEAPLPPVNAEPILNAQRAVSEKYNQAFACIKTWNTTVSDYNMERQKVPGDVVGSIAEYLGVRELPEELPYFVMQGAITPGQAPTLAPLQP